jgi:hypothetical protein
LVAHYLQHRIEPGHLREIADAWDCWALSEEELRRVARQTCSEVALEFALHAAAARGEMRRKPIALTSARARLLLRLTDSGARIGGESTARLLSLVASSPARIPSQLWSGVVLESDDLLARYGTGNRVAQTLRRARDLLGRG